MSDDINSPRVRQVLAIHANQAAEAKAEYLIEHARALQAEVQRDELYALVKGEAAWLVAKAPVMGALRDEFAERGWKLHKLARGFVNDPGPCPADHDRIFGTACEVCGAIPN